MLQSLREETEGKFQMLLSAGKSGLDSLFKEVSVFKDAPRCCKISDLGACFLSRIEDQAFFTKKRFLSEKGGGKSVKEGLGKDF